MTTFDIERVLSDYSIDHLPENSRGWICVPCIYCQTDRKYKLGIRQEGKVSCFACGSHPFDETLSLLTGQNWYEIKHEYMTNISPRDLYLLNHSEDIQRPQKLSLPDGTAPLNDRARKYLKDRNYDPDYLVETFKLQSTGIHGHYNFRIVIPIYFKHQLVSFTCRDYTGQSSIRYLSCPASEEIVCHKDILYGYDDIPEDTCICVEGPFDRMRLGVHSVCLFGSSFTQGQVNLLSTFKKVYILFDDEKEAQDKANRLGELLCGLGTEAEVITLSGVKDPGSLSQKEANQLVEDLI